MRRLIPGLLFWYYIVQLGGGTIYFAPIQFKVKANCEQGRLDAISATNSDGTTVSKCFNSKAQCAVLIEDAEHCVPIPPSS